MLGTRDGVVRGTVQYMSPEQASGETLDARTDLFSFGVVLYELTTGRPPFQGTVPTLVIDSILHATPPPLRSRQPAIPAPFERIVLRLLEKDRARRYQTASELRDDLRSLEHDLLHTAASGDRAWQRRGVQLVIATVLIVGGALGAWRWAQAPHAPTSDPAKYEQLTYFAASATSPSLSRDGRMVTFIQGTEWFNGPGQIYVKALPDGEPVQLTHDTLSKMSPTFSPDGSSIVYTVARPPGQWDAWLVPVPGGDARLWLKNAGSLSWLPDKRIMFSEVTTGMHMRVVSSRESRDDIRAVYTPSHEQGMAHWSHLSPDGTRVLIVEMEGGAWLPCRLVSLDGSSSDRRAGPDGQCISAAWSPDGKWVYTSSLSNGAFHIWRQRVPEGIPEQLTSGPNEEEGLAVAPDGMSLLVSLGSSQQAIWLRDDGGERAVSTEGYAFVPSLPAALVQPFSTDGKTLFYLARRGGVRMMGPAERAGELWKTDVDTGRSELVLPGVNVVGYDISRDMTQVAFAALGKDLKPHVWLARLDHQLPARQLSTLAADNPRFGARDEVFTRVTEGPTAFSYVYRMRVDESEAQKVVTPPIVFFMSASPDGAWILARTAAGTGRTGDTVAFPTNGGAAIAVCANCQADWTADAKALVIRVNLREALNRTIVLALEAGRMLPRLPATGIRSEADLAGLSVLSAVDGFLFPGLNPRQYAFGRIATQRNIYRIPLR